MKSQINLNHFLPYLYYILAILLGCSTSAHAQLDWCDTFAQDRLFIDESNEFYVENFSVSVSGDTAVVGAQIYDNEEYDSAVFVFVQTRDQWNLQATLIPQERNSYFGYSVAISGDTIVIGAPHDDYFERNNGAAYVYTRSDGVWTQQAILDGSFEPDHFRFGYDVDIDQDNIIIGVEDSCNDDYCTGVAHIFTRTNNEWAHAAMLTPQDRDNSESFAITVAISGNTAVVSSVDGFQDVINIPLASVYTITDGVWTFESTLIPNDLHDVDHEVSLAIEDDTIVMGSTSYEIPDNDAEGAALIFTRTNQTWTHEASLSNYDKDISRQFGIAVDIDQGRVLVSPDNGFTDESDPVILFTKTDGVWNETISFAPSSTDESYDRFGSSISLSGDHIIIGFEYADEMTNAHPFALDLYCDTTCYADLQENGILDFYDFSIFRNAFISNDPLADFYADGEIDLFDLFAYMIAFNRGCYIPPEPLQNPN
tara:strand:- start:621409 stop:622854 length:1446 start_codon:yes stop_codon:yes gene_type:complete